MSWKDKQQNNIRQLHRQIVEERGKASDMVNELQSLIRRLDNDIEKYVGENKKSNDYAMALSRLDMQKDFRPLVEDMRKIGAKLDGVLKRFDETFDNFE